MSYWNVRVIRTEPVAGEYMYDLHEVFYDNNDRPSAWTSAPVGPHGESVDEVREYLVMCSIALSRPVLVERMIGGRTVLVDEPLLTEVPAGYVGIQESGYLAIHQQKFSGPGPRVAKVVAVGDHYELVEFKGHQIGKADRARLQPWVDRL